MHSKKTSLLPLVLLMSLALALAASSAGAAGRCVLAELFLSSID